MSDLFSALEADFGIGREGGRLRFTIDDASALLAPDEVIQLRDALGAWLREAGYEGGGETDAEVEEPRDLGGIVLCLLEGGTAGGKPTCVVQSFPTGNHQGRVETRCRLVHAGALLGFAPLAEVACEACRGAKAR